MSRRSSDMDVAFERAAGSITFMVMGRESVAHRPTLATQTRHNPSANSPRQSSNPRPGTMTVRAPTGR
jgi:hypothetical protein